MKRYLIFLGLEYYPEGGMNDFLIDCDTLEECKIAINKEIKTSNYKERYNWSHIYDTETKKIVWNK